MEILIAIGILGGLGLIFGLVLAVASKVFYVETDPRLDELNECLPGANCGGCGYAGCGGYAEAVLNGEAEIGKCASGGNECAMKMAEIMGVKAEKMERRVAMVRCSGYKAVDEEGNPFEVVNWYGKDYIGEENLLKVVANTLKNTYFSGDGSSFTGLTPADIKCVDRLVTDAKAYEVYFQLSDTGEAKSWYKYEGGNYTAISVDELNTALAAVQPALVYNDGMTYYWLDIKHLGIAGSTTEYGIVRNHVYKVNINDITGYGTPVYDGTSDFINLEKPEDIITYVSAQINILSWRVVEGNYNVE